jgi:hypothetical protein
MRGVYILIIALLSSMQTGFRSIENNDVWVIDRSSTLAIDGSSNVNQFTCSIREYLSFDTLWNSSDAGRKRLLFRESRLNVDVRRFDCQHKFITADFRKMLQAGEYPFLTIEFISLEELKTGSVVKGVVDIILAGRKKRMEILYTCRQNGPAQVMLKGEKLMKFTDFQLEPPRKLGGLIRINEDIRVHFNLNFRKII